MEKAIKLPLRIGVAPEAIVIEDAVGVQLWHHDFEGEPSRRNIMHRMTKDKARELAQRIARALTNGETS